MYGVDGPFVGDANPIRGVVGDEWLWPALVKLSSELDTARLGAIREEHLPGGKHELRVTEFPQWVPAEVLAASKRLTRSEAQSLLANLTDRSK